MTPYVAPLTEEWAVWRWVVVRGSGFRASLATDLGAPELAAAVDALADAETAVDEARGRVLDRLALPEGAPAELVRAHRELRKRIKRGKVVDAGAASGVVDAEIRDLAAAVARADALRAAVPATFAAARDRVAHTTAQVIADPRFREALTWQNPSAVDTAIESLLRRGIAEATASRDRQHAELVVKYLHRYTTKNDSIGFFGPIGWARIEDVEERIRVRPGKALVADRQVHLEHWAVDAVADVLSAADGIRPWIAPRAFAFVRIDGLTAHNPLTGRIALTPPELLALQRCDGRTAARDIAAALVRDHAGELATEDAVYAALESLRVKQIIAWKLTPPLVWTAFDELRRRCEKIGDETLRRAGIEALSRLEHARADVARAAGDFVRLGGALRSLRETFTSLTHAASSRNAGATYGARELVFEDCRRDIDFVIGPRLLGDLSGPLSLMLTSARWLTFEAASAYRDALSKLHGDLARKHGAAVPLTELWFRSRRLFHGATSRLVDGIAERCRAKWASILRIDPGTARISHTAAELRPLVEEAFQAPGAGWPSARHHSPDLMIAAPSVDAIARGDYFAMLGEVHVGMNTMDQKMWHACHPSPDALRAAMAMDVPEGRIQLVANKDTLRASIRATSALVSPQDYELEAGFEESLLPKDRVLRLADLVVENVEGRLRVRDRHRPHVDLDLLEPFHEDLQTAIVNELDIAPSLPHCPRITIDRLVVKRETWRIDPTTLAFANEKNDLDRFTQARRWVRALGLPRFAFVKSTLEVKPVYVDFESPIAVEILGKIVRRAAEGHGPSPLVLSEMLPSFEDVWLPDADGNKYTCELRFVAVDSRRR